MMCAHGFKHHMHVITYAFSSRVRSHMIMSFDRVVHAHHIKLAGTAKVIKSFFVYIDRCWLNSLFSCRKVNCCIISNGSLCGSSCICM